MRNFNLKLILLMSLVLPALSGYAGGDRLHSKPDKALSAEDLLSRRAAYTNYIVTHYADQLTNPQKKKRLSYSQFGYNLSFFTVQLFPITEFIDPSYFGQHSYGQPARSEKNGSLYTCKGGFMDFSHIRCAADWTVYLAFRMIVDDHDFDLSSEGAKMNLHLENIQELPVEDITSLAQRISFERLVWHEVESWYHHTPNFVLTEQQSTFTPEDLYSDYLGTEVGKNIVLRILRDKENLPFAEIANQEIEKIIASLDPVAGVKESKMAYDIVDRNKQMKLNKTDRNNDVWWNSKMLFRDERYVFKRETNMGPQLSPWLVPDDGRVGCPAVSDAAVKTLPEKTNVGVSLNRYYTFSIEPDSILFYHKKTGKKLDEPIAPFISSQLPQIVANVTKEMEKELLPGFNKRNDFDPVPYYKNVRTVVLK